jgi:two-component system, NarL family, sensor kinase
MHTVYDIKYFIALGIAVMFLLFASFLLALIASQKKKNKYQENLRKLKEEQQNQLIEAAVRSEETERHRIAETLHDEVGAILSSAKLHLLGVKGDTLSEKDKKLYEKGGSLLNDVIKRVRGISHNLHSNILKEFGFNEAVRHFLQQVSGSNIEEATTDLDDNYNSPTADNDISLYRTVQELINNIIKYANAKQLHISSFLKGEKMELIIYHNGNGIDQQQFEDLSFKKEGLGLKNIRNRLLLIKGQINFKKDTDGYRIHITIPYTPQTLNHE